MAQRHERQVVEAKSDTKKIQFLEDRIKELEQIIGQKQVLIEFQDKKIEIAESTYEADIKKIRHQTLLWYWQNREKHSIKMNQLYSVLSIKKQSFFQKQKRREKHLDESEQILLLKDKVRVDHPCLSAREIYGKLNPPVMGRDKFEAFCFEHGYG